MIWLVAGCAWAGLAFWVWALCVAAGSADDARARLLGLCEACEGDGCRRCLGSGRRLRVGMPEKVGRAPEPPIPEAVDVWRAYPGLTFLQARAVAARRLQEKRTPKPLG